MQYIVFRFTVSIVSKEPELLDNHTKEARPPTSYPEGDRGINLFNNGLGGAVSALCNNSSEQCRPRPSATPLRALEFLAAVANRRYYASGAKNSNNSCLACYAAGGRRTKLAAKFPSRSPGAIPEARSLIRQQRRRAGSTQSLQTDIMNPRIA